MAVPSRFLLQQAPVLGGLVRGAAVSLAHRAFGVPALSAPFPKVTARVPPRSPDLVATYLAYVGGDEKAYQGVLPPHLFPQWGFPLATRALASLGLPIERVLNAGCRLEMGAPLPSDEPLEVSAQIVSVDNDGRRAIVRTLVETKAASPKALLRAEMVTLIPLSRGGRGEKKEKKARPEVASSAREVASFDLASDAGLDYAKLTGDVNPIHWVPGAARASGFRSCILHGFASMAFAMEGLYRSVLAGDVRSLSKVEVSFTSPLVLPAKARLFVDEHRFFMGEALGAIATLEGSFERRSERSV